MSKKIYVCGASDCTHDKKFPNQSWHEKFAESLPDGFDLHNIAIPGASNFLIRLQIDRALDDGADAIIIHFTSSVRTEILLNDRLDKRPLLDRFYNPNVDDTKSTLLSLSRIQAKNQPGLDNRRVQILKDYQLEFFSLDCAVHLNYYLIRSALEELVSRSETKFIYSLGGFEHPDYTDSPSDHYHRLLQKYDRYQSEKNLWDHFTDWKARLPNMIRPDIQGPAFHISDPKINQDISDYYLNWTMSTV